VSQPVFSHASIAPDASPATLESSALPRLRKRQFLSLPPAEQGWAERSGSKPFFAEPGCQPVTPNRDGPRLFSQENVFLASEFRLFSVSRAAPRKLPGAWRSPAFALRILRHCQTPGLQRVLRSPHDDALALYSMSSVGRAPLKLNFIYDSPGAHSIFFEGKNLSYKVTPPPTPGFLRLPHEYLPSPLSQPPDVMRKRRLKCAAPHEGHTFDDRRPLRKLRPPILPLRSASRPVPGRGLWCLNGINRIVSSNSLLRASVLTWLGAAGVALSPWSVERGFYQSPFKRTPGRVGNCFQLIL